MHPNKKSVSSTNLKAKKIVRGLHGEGDGVRQNITCRTPSSGNRKFREGIKLVKILDKEPAATPPKSILKSASVAEITPTKTPIKRLSSISTDSCDIYATPRPFDEVPKRQLCDLEQSTCKNSKIFMKCAWLWLRADLITKREWIKKQKNQITKMEMEIDVLKKLRTSESKKRDETHQKCQLLKDNVEELKLKVSQLTEEIESLQNTFVLYKNELKVVQAENNLLGEHSLKMQDVIAKNKSEKMALDEKVKLREEDIKAQKTIISTLEATLEETLRDLQQARNNCGIKEKKYVHLKCQFKKQLEETNSISTKLESLKQENQNISYKAEELEMQLNDYIENCANLEETNENLNREVLEISTELREERKQRWLKNAKRFALLSFGALERIARVAVPVYMDRPVNF